MPTYQHTSGERVHIPHGVEEGSGLHQEAMRLEISPDWQRVADEYAPVTVDTPAGDAEPDPETKPRRQTQSRE
jgi:hypothetical protein